MLDSFTVPVICTSLFASLAVTLLLLSMFVTLFTALLLLLLPVLLMFILSRVQLVAISDYNCSFRIKSKHLVSM